MTHPAVIKASQLIIAGDLAGAETALATIADTEGDAALVEILDEVEPKDLLAIMRSFDGSKESVVNMVVTPEQFARAVVLESRYRDIGHTALRGMMNAVLFKDPDQTEEYLETLGELEGGYSVIANYFEEKAEEVLVFASSGLFSDEADFDGGPEIRSDARSIGWLSEKIDELDQALYDGDGIADAKPKVSRAEIADNDWMEVAWILRHQLPDIFEQVMVTLRDRLLKYIEKETDSATPNSNTAPPPTNPSLSKHDDEESAL